MTTIEPKRAGWLGRFAKAMLGLAGSPWGAGLIGVALGVFPPVGIGLVGIVGANGSARAPRTDARINWALACLTVVRMVLSWRVSGNPLLGLLEGIVIWLTYRGAMALAGSFRFIALGLTVGLGLAVTQALVSVWFPPPQPWQVEEPARVRLETQTTGLRITPLDPSNAWVVRFAGPLGPGRIAYSLEFRSERPQRVNVSIIAPGLQGGRIDRTCEAGPAWRPCRLEARLPTRTVFLVGMGGYGLWKRGDATLEMRLERLTDLDPASPLTVLTNLPRASGTAFNPNAFGAWMAALGVLVLIARLDWWVRLTALGFSIIGILLSGSRSALTTALVAALFLVLSRSSRPLTWALTALAVLTVFTAQVFPQLIGGIRALRFLTEDGNTASRLEQFRLAFESFLSNPIFGTGNLREAMMARWTPQLTTPVDAVAHAHNLFLQVAGESGLLGLIVLLALLYTSLTLVLRSRQWIAGLTVLIAILLLNLADYFFWYAPLQAAFWFAVAVSANEGANKNPEMQNVANNA